MKSACLIAIVLMVLFSCKKENLPDENLSGSENFNRTIKFDVIHVYSFSPLQDSVIEHATINIYSDYYDFLNGAYPDATRQTDSTGYAEINGLDKNFYYIRAIHPSFTDVIDSVSTPANTVSFVEMIFY